MQISKLHIQRDLHTFVLMVRNLRNTQTCSPLTGREHLGAVLSQIILKVRHQLVSRLFDSLDSSSHLLSLYQMSAPKCLCHMPVICFSFVLKTRQSFFLFVVTLFFCCTIVYYFCHKAFTSLNEFNQCVLILWSQTICKQNNRKFLTFFLTFLNVSKLLPAECLHSLPAENRKCSPEKVKQHSCCQP